MRPYSIDIGISESSVVSRRVLLFVISRRNIFVFMKDNSIGKFLLHEHFQVETNLFLWMTKWIFRVTRIPSSGRITISPSFTSFSIILLEKTAIPLPQRTAFLMASVLVLRKSGLIEYPVRPEAVRIDCGLCCRFHGSHNSDPEAWKE